jgi:hypothetical protein
LIDLIISYPHCITSARKINQRHNKIDFAQNLEESHILARKDFEEKHIFAQTGFEESHKLAKIKLEEKHILC